MKCRNDATRGLVPGLAYQLGILFAAPTNTVEYALRDRVGYQWALAGFEIMTIVVLRSRFRSGRSAAAGASSNRKSRPSRSRPQCAVAK